MKYLRLFENRDEEIRRICRRHGIGNYTRQISYMITIVEGDQQLKTADVEFTLMFYHLTKDSQYHKSQLFHYLFHGY